ncbi:MAG: peptidase [Cyanobacteria bacterium J06638_6]
MPDNGLQQFWELVWGVLTFNPNIFLNLENYAYSQPVAITVVLLAGFSQAIGQSIVLFVNRIKPLRFFLSLGVAGFIFAATFVFWVISSWLIVAFIFGVKFQVGYVAIALALCYAPQLFAFLVALPYFGVSISVLLSIWTLLTITVGLEATTNLTTWQVLASVGLGWLVLQLGARTIGRPLNGLGRWLMTTAAGQQLITQSTELEALFDQMAPGMPRLSSPITQSEALSDPAPGRSLTTRRGYRFLAITFSAFLVLILIATSQRGVVIWFQALEDATRLVIDLVAVSLIALVVAILLTPLESLTWWAGWQGDQPLNPGVPVRPTPKDGAIERYVTYLDGINQGTYGYLPEVENFLDQLAAGLPPNILVVKGIIPYSVTNRPLTENNSFAFLWRWVDRVKAALPRIPIGFAVNLRNIFAVMTSADARYGPIQNRGLAQVLYDSLLYHGYQPGSGIPIALIGFSGGGQMSMGSVRYLQQAIAAPTEVISIAGVISGNTGAMQIRRLYHLAGRLDPVQKLGAIFFPARWPVALLSNWNKAKRRGRIILVSLGEVGHSGASGPMSTSATLADGRTHLQQTIDIVSGILLKDWTRSRLNKADFVHPSNYELYQAADFNQVAYYPVAQVPDPTLYRPMGAWLGRLILPPLEARPADHSVLMEVYHAPAGYRHWVGRIVSLRWSEAADVQAYVQLVTMDVAFVEQVQLSQRQGFVHPERINHWPQVDPLESIAGSHPIDDITVLLHEPVQGVEVSHGPWQLIIRRDPVHLTGRFYGLVQIQGPTGHDRFRVRHYNRSAGQFDGPTETVYIPSVLPNRDDIYQSSNRQIEQSPLNPEGWYIFGAQNQTGEFVVQAIAPFHMFDLKADQVIIGKKPCLHYINYDYWKDVHHQKGQVITTLLLPQIEGTNATVPTLQDIWQEGDRALVMEVYGGIGGNKKEFAPGNIYFGHFAFGLARVLREPLTDQLRFDLECRQIFTHSPEAVIAGANHWTRFMGDRQYGRVGFRPVADVLIKFPPFTEDYDFDGVTFSPMNRLIRELDVMGARYRIGDGTGTTSVTPVNSCVQDSTQALLTALHRLVAEFRLNPLMLKWLRDHPDHEQTQRFLLLRDLLKSLEANLQPLGFTRPDWRSGALTLGQFAGETPGKTMVNALASWRSLLPRLANDVITMIFLQLGATVWVIRANQIGGDDPDIEPIAPTDFEFRVPKIKRSRSLN